MLFWPCWTALALLCATLGFIQEVGDKKMKTKQFKIEDKLALYAHLDKNEIWIYLPPSAEFTKEKGRTIVKISYKKDAKTLGAKVKKLWQQS